MLGLTLCQVDLGNLIGILFFPFDRITFCHSSELNQLAEGASCLGLTTDRQTCCSARDNAANEGSMSKMLSCVRSSDSFFWEMRTWRLKRVYLHLGTKTCLGKLLERQSLGMLLLTLPLLYPMTGKLESTWGMINTLMHDQDCLCRYRWYFFSSLLQILYAVSTLSKLEPFRERK